MGGSPSALAWKAVPFDREQGDANRIQDFVHDHFEKGSRNVPADGWGESSSAGLNIRLQSAILIRTALPAPRESRVGSAVRRFGSTMPLPQPKPAGHTLEEWAGWVGRWELIDCVPYDMTPAPGLEHQRVSAHLTMEIGMAMKTARGIEGIPELVVEILSPGSGSRDRLLKRWKYERAGIPEYLIVDPDARLGFLLCLMEGRYQEAARVAWGAQVALLGGTLKVTLH